MNHELPKGWAYSTLGELAIYIQRGKSPQYAEKSSLPVVNQKCIRWFGIQEEHLKFIHPEQFSAWSQERYISTGDILWNSTGTGTIGRACIVTERDCESPKVIDSHVTLIRLDKWINSHYVFRWIQSSHVQDEISGLHNGSTNQVELSREKVRSLAVPLPPLPEQHRIVAKLDSILPRVEKVRERLEKIPALVKRFRQSVLTAAVTGKLTERWRVKNPAAGEWKNISLGETLVDIRYGTAKKCGHESTGTPVLRIPNIVCGTINVDDLKFAEFDQREIDSLSVRQDDLLMIRSNGSVSLVGKTALVTSQVSGYLFAGYLIRLRLNKDFTSPRFLNYALNAPAIREHIERTSRSAAGVNNINSEEIKGIPIDFPPFDEQQEIVRQVDKLFSLADKLEARYHRAMARIEKFPQAILAKAFRGELVPQDPNDEPAEKLLELIRQEREKLESTPKSSGSRKPRRVSVKMGA